MSDIMTGITGLLSHSWRFLMNTYIPGTEIAFGVVFVGVCVMGLGFRLLSLVLGFSVGVPGTATAEYGSRSGGLMKISQERSLDIR